MAPLQQDTSKRSAIASAAAAALDSRTAVPSLNPSERDKCRQLINAERVRLKPDAKAERKRWLVREGSKLGPDGERILKAALDKGTLSGGVTLQFDDDELGVATI